MKVKELGVNVSSIVFFFFFLHVGCSGSYIGSLERQLDALCSRMQLTGSSASCKLSVVVDTFCQILAVWYDCTLHRTAVVNTRVTVTGSTSSASSWPTGSVLHLQKKTSTDSRYDQHAVKESTPEFNHTNRCFFSVTFVHSQLDEFHLSFLCRVIENIKF